MPYCRTAHPLTRLQKINPPPAAAKDLTSLLPVALAAQNKNAENDENSIDAVGR